MFPTFSSRREEESSEQPRSHLIGGLFSLERLPDLPHVKHGRHASSDVHLRLYTAHIPHTVKSCRRQRRNTGDDVMTASTTVTTAREERTERLKSCPSSWHAENPKRVHRYKMYNVQSMLLCYFVDCTSAYYLCKL